MVAVATIDHEYRDLVADALRRDRRTPKEWARTTGATPRAVENWRGGLHGPSVPHFIALAREIPEVKAKVLEWLDASTGDSGRNPDQVALELAQEFSRFLEERSK